MPRKKKAKKFETIFDHGVTKEDLVAMHGEHIIVSGEADKILSMSEEEYFYKELNGDQDKAYFWIMLLYLARGGIDNLKIAHKYYKKIKDPKFKEFVFYSYWWELGAFLNEEVASLVKGW